MSTWLYSDSGFDAWTSAVKSSSSSTENEKEWVDSYSSYVLRIFCNITKIEVNSVVYDKTNNRAGSGCCIRDKTAKGGGYCMFIDSQDKTIETKYLNDQNFEVSTASPYEIVQTTIQNSQEGITTFKIDTITYGESGTSSKPDKWYGSKVQPRAAASYT